MSSISSSLFCHRFTNRNGNRSLFVTFWRPSWPMAAILVLLQWPALQIESLTIKSSVSLIGNCLRRPSAKRWRNWLMPSVRWMSPDIGERVKHRAVMAIGFGINKRCCNRPGVLGFRIMLSNSTLSWLTITPPSTASPSNVPIATPPMSWMGFSITKVI